MSTHKISLVYMKRIVCFHTASYKMCNFETDFCDWTNLDDDEFDWKRDRGGTSSGNTGPGTDHTTKTNEGAVK